MVMHKKAWMTTYLFKQWLVFFYKFILGGGFQGNQHLLILNGHGSHITIQTLEHVVKVGLEMVTLRTHTSYVLQPLDVTYFKSFKTTFRKERNSSLAKNNYLEPNKVIL